MIPMVFLVGETGSGEVCLNIGVEFVGMEF